MTQLRDRMIRQMQLHRLADKTQKSYLWHVKALARYYHTPPDRLSPCQIQDYLHHLLVERQLAWSTCNQAMAGFVFFYLKVLSWPRVSLKLPPRKRQSKLPEVWPQAELLRLFEAPRYLKHRVLLMTIYAAGLRVSEAVQLTADDLNVDRMTLRVHQGKGHKDRDTLLSSQLLDRLRDYWRQCRRGTCSRLMFPGSDESRPFAISSAQRMYQRACAAIDNSRRGGIHSLRHSFATHLLEAGVNIRVIQHLMGHASINTTTRYLQLRRGHLEAVRSPLDLLSPPPPPSR